MPSTTKHFLSILLVLAIFIACGNFLITFDAGAQGLWDSQYGKDEVGQAFGQNSTPTDIRIIAAQIIRVFLGFMGIIFVGIMIVAGFQWMNSAGSTSQVDEAKARLKTAVIGLIIVLASYAVASYVTNCIFDISKGGQVWYCEAS